MKSTKKKPDVNPDLTLCQALEKDLPARADRPSYVVVVDDPLSKSELRPEREVAFAVYLPDRDVARRLSCDPGLLRPALYERRGKRWQVVTVWKGESPEPPEEKPRAPSPEPRAAPLAKASGEEAEKKLFVVQRKGAEADFFVGFADNGPIFVDYVEDAKKYTSKMDAFKDVSKYGFRYNFVEVSP